MPNPNYRIFDKTLLLSVAFSIGSMVEALSEHRRRRSFYPFIMMLGAQLYRYSATWPCLGKKQCPGRKEPQLHLMNDIGAPIEREERNNISVVFKPAASHGANDAYARISTPKRQKHLQVHKKSLSASSWPSNRFLME